MKVRVRLFGPLAQAAGRGEITVESRGASAADVLEAVRRAHPGLPLANVKIAVNSDYASPRTAVKPDDVVSLLPPVGGG
jgi:molybdopterin converting factor small subunit